MVCIPCKALYKCSALPLLYLYMLLQYNTIRGQFIAQRTTKPERLGITMLINDKSRLKRNVERIDFQLALKPSKSLNRSDRLRQTVPYCRPVTEKARSPNLVLVRGTMKSRLLAERRR